MRVFQTFLAFHDNKIFSFEQYCEYILWNVSIGVFLIFLMIRPRLLEVHRGDSQHFISMINGINDITIDGNLR